MSITINGVSIRVVIRFAIFGILFLLSRNLIMSSASFFLTKNPTQRIHITSLPMIQLPLAGMAKEGVEGCDPGEWWCASGGSASGR
jgi:hypothetical protein